MPSLREDLESSLSTLNSSGDQNEQQAAAPAAPDPSSGEQEGYSVPRDASGRFAPREPAREPVPAAGEPQAQAPAPAPVAQPNQTPAEGQAPTAPAPGAQAPAAQPAAGVPRAPVSWTPEARADWETLPPKIQAEVIRREQQMDRFMQETAPARRFAAEVENTLRPYMHFIQAEGSNPLQAIDNVMKTAAFLRTAPPMQRAEAMADLVFQHGIDLGLFERSLVSRIQRGADPQYQMQTALQQQIQQQLAPVTQFINQFQQQQQQAQLAPINQEITAFINDPKNVYARELAGDMADIIDMYAARGQQIDLSEAYRRATMAHPTIGPELIRQQQSQSVAQQTAAAQRALNAAVSPAGSGAPSQNEVPQGDGSLRSDVLSAINALSSQGRR